MKRKEEDISLRRKIDRTIIMLFALFVAICVVLVLLFEYQPDRNSLGALGTVCMDVISMAILLILSISISSEKEKKSQTTKLFLSLMLMTVVALFFDFLTWASDGSLTYGGWTYVFTMSSLVCGSILASFFVMYLCSYIDEMYDMTAPYFSARICVICNIIAFIVTVSIAVTNNAFVFVDGHYETGSLYDVITVIPILTLLYMAAVTVRHVKTIGVHDVIAVAGYIFTMIAGAIVEAVYSIGATYVSVAIADVFIFIMLQSKMIGRVKKQKAQLDEEITSQYAILKSMAGIYSYVNYIDYTEMTARRFDVQDAKSEELNIRQDPHTVLNKNLHENIRDEYKDNFWAYTDLSTLPERMMGEKIISAEFRHKKDGWFRAQYIRIGDDIDEHIERVIYAIRNIDEEKRNVEKWIKKSNTDELTGFLNRHAYEDDLALLEKSGIKENFVYVSVDVNSLKLINDTKGHDAGDELITGACECMRQCFGAYGKLYRTGGDEFAALIFADEAQLAEIRKDLDEVTDNWSGTLIDEIAISCGYVSKKEAENMTLREMAILADKRMYEDKNRYYRKKGIDRRGQRDAHVALYALYTKILKVNVADDSYQIVNMNESEKTSEMGFSDSFSKWMKDFGTSGQVHPDDLAVYLERTSLEYIGAYFVNESRPFRLFYRRKYNEEYRRVMMEIVPANDYSDKSQNLFLYVKEVE